MESAQSNETLAADPVETVAATPSELGVALVTLARALRPNGRRGRAEFDRKIRRAISRAKPDHVLLRFLLEEMIE